MIKNKRGNILTENIVFILLNLAFVAILVLFVFSKTGDVALLEEKYAKQIALVLDSAKPGMEISMNLEVAVDKAEKEKFEGKIVSIDGNLVTVRLGEGKGYSYSFFNDVDLNKLYFYPNEGDNFVFKVEKYKSNVGGIDGIK